MDTAIVFSKPQFDQLREHLLSTPHMEQSAFLLAAPNRTHSALQLLVREVIPLASSDFDIQSGAYLSIKDECSKAVLQRCRAEGWSLIETHSHPFCQEGVSFSGIDRANENKKFRYVARKIPGIYHATMVFGQQSLDAHLFDWRRKIVCPINSVIVRGSPFAFHLPTSRKGMFAGLLSATHFEQDGSFDLPNAGDNRYDRQVLAFGSLGQACLKKVCVAIVGLGGVGSHVAQQLAHLGVEKFILIDHDRVEETNLNRLIGATWKSSLRREYKVDVARSMLRRINPHARVQRLRSLVHSPDALFLLKGADVIFGATDNDSSRLVINRVAVQYLIPYLDIGTGIEVDGNTIKSIGGQVRVVLPGQGYCLSCIDGYDRFQAGYDFLSASQLVMRQLRGYGLGESTPAPAVVFLNGIFASIAVGEFLNLIVGYKPMQTYTLLDLHKGQLLNIRAERRTDCLCCSQVGYFATGDLEAMPYRIRDPGALQVPSVISQEESSVECEV